MIVIFSQKVLLFYLILFNNKRYHLKYDLISFRSNGIDKITVNGDIGFDIGK